MPGSPEPAGEVGRARGPPSICAANTSDGHRDRGLGVERTAPAPHRGPANPKSVMIPGFYQRVRRAAQCHPTDLAFRTDPSVPACQDRRTTSGTAVLPDCRGLQFRSTSPLPSGSGGWTLGGTRTREGRGADRPPLDDRGTPPISGPSAPHSRIARTPRCPVVLPRVETPARRAWRSTSSCRWTPWTLLTSRRSAYWTSSPLTLVGSRAYRS